MFIYPLNYYSKICKFCQQKKEKENEFQKWVDYEINYRENKSQRIKLSMENLEYGYLARLIKCKNLDLIDLKRQQIKLKRLIKTKINENDCRIEK
jgi:hypothetical protein